MIPAALSEWILRFDHFVIWYFLALNGGYILLCTVSLFLIQRHMRFAEWIEDGPLFRSGLAPAISVIVPAHDEEATIVDSIQSLLALEYPKFEIVIVNDGRIVADGQVEELRSSAMRENRYRVQFGQDGPEAGDALKGLDGVTGLESAPDGGSPAWLVRSALDRDLRRDINELARGKGWDLLELSPLRPTLEEAFIELTGRREN